MESRVVVVTGGSAGVGRAAVRALADRGWDVENLARGEQGVRGAVTDVQDRGRRAVGLIVDVADRGALESAADSVERQVGRVDAWGKHGVDGGVRLCEG